jgi:hypothetical protein
MTVSRDQAWAVPGVNETQRDLVDAFMKKRNMK